MLNDAAFQTDVSFENLTKRMSLDAKMAYSGRIPT